MEITDKPDKPTEQANPVKTDKTAEYIRQRINEVRNHIEGTGSDGGHKTPGGSEANVKSDSYGNNAQITPNDVAHWSAPLLVEKRGEFRVVGSTMYVGDGRFFTAGHTRKSIKSKKVQTFIGGSEIGTHPGRFLDLEYQSNDFSNPPDLDMGMLRVVAETPESKRLEAIGLADATLIDETLTNQEYALIIGFGEYKNNAGADSLRKNDVVVRLLPDPCETPKCVRSNFANWRNEQRYCSYFMAYSEKSGPANSASGAPIVIVRGDQVFMIGMTVQRVIHNKLWKCFAATGSNYSLYLKAPLIGKDRNALKV